MRGQHLMVTAIGLALAVGCGKREKTEPREVPAALAQYVLESVPEEVENRTFIDFEGKVHLLAHEIAPEGPVKPGGKLQLELYWKSVAPLDPGWSLFTHVLDPLGRPVQDEADGDGFDDIGPLRRRPSPDAPQMLSPSAWTPGKVYLDTQELRIPPTVKARKLTILVGIEKPLELPEPDPDADADESELVDEGPRSARLRILSGPSDGRDRALVGHVATTNQPSEQQPLELHRAVPLKPGQTPPMRPNQRRPAPPPGRQPR